MKPPNNITIAEINLYSEKLRFIFCSVKCLSSLKVEINVVVLKRHNQIISKYTTNVNNKYAEILTASPSSWMLYCDIASVEKNWGIK